MGLDMYLEGRKFFWHSDKPRMEDGKPVRGVTVDLGYWRKHPDLHGFIVETFAGGKDDCQDIELDADKLTQIIVAVQRGELPHTEGFFFGHSYASHPGADAKDIANERDDDVKQLRAAFDWLQSGDAAPFENDVEVGPVFTAVKIKPKAETENRQKVSRSVVYRASW